MKLIKQSTAPFFMLMVSVLFGLNYVWTKILVQAADMFVILFLADVLGLVLTIVYIKAKKLSLKVDFKALAIVNIVFMLSNLIGMWGMVYTSSSHASFILQTTVILIPIVSAVSKRRRPQGAVLALGAVALVGIGIMTLDFNSFSVNIGDVLVLVSAVAFAVYIVLLERLKKVHAVVLMFYYYLIGISIHFVLALVFSPQGAFNLPIYNLNFILPFVAFTCTGLLVSILQVEVLKFIKPELMAIYYCFEPITTVIVAYFLLREMFGAQMFIGGAIVLLTMVAPSLPVFKRFYNNH